MRYSVPVRPSTFTVQLLNCFVLALALRVDLISRHSPSSFAVRDPLQNLARRISRHNLDPHHFAASCFHFLAPDNLIRRPIPAFHQNVRQQCRNYTLRRRFLEDDYCIHAFETRQNFRALFGRDHRPTGSLQPTHAPIAVQTHYQRVTLSPRLLEDVNVARMQQVEAAIRKHYLPAVAFPRAKSHNQFV
jgi:hypothetical protein